ncbi:hypothetical protein CK203_001178 [Vitis vinifera]|uniref:Uncharacterized protein n=1 Tax=Vitis vinifera TaxID=29760 RepID=A0A438KKR6_VITVI|nr:hypothetical protein CK203_001178 [Vitis vinifera]
MLMFYIVHDSRHLNHPIHTKVVLHFLGIMLKNLSPKRLAWWHPKVSYLTHRSGKVKDHGSGSMGKVMVSLFNLNHLPCKSYGLFLVLQKRAIVVQVIWIDESTKGLVLPSLSRRTLIGIQKFWTLVSMNCFHVYSNKSCPIPSLSMLGWIASEKKKQSTRCLYSALICSKISCLDMVIDWITFAQFYRCMLNDFSIMLFLYFGGKAVLALGLEIAQRKVFPIHIYAMVSALVPCFECL